MTVMTGAAAPPVATQTVPSAQATQGTPARVSLRVLALLLPLLFVVYATSFVGFDIIEEQHSVLADSDAANFLLIVRNFEFGTKFGNEYATENRSVGDIAQKHKMHHPLYALAGSTLHDVLAPAYRAVGLPPRAAAYGVNAIIGCLNVLLLALLLRRHNRFGNPIAPFLLLYGLALGTWVYASVPESWPFSAAMVLLFFLLPQGTDYRLRAAAVGVLMLNNIFLFSLMGVAAVEIWRATGRLRGAWVLKCGVSAVVALAVWLTGLSVLSLFDSSFRPDHFMRYTLWFREHTHPGLSITDFYVWKSAASNLFINSVVSNQADPFVPQEALLLTLQQSRLGLIAVAAYIVTVLALLGSVVRRNASAPVRNFLASARSDRATDIALFCAIMLLVTAVVYYAAGMLYSCVVVPFIVVALGRYLDLRRRWARVAFSTVVALIIINNAEQVLQFRAALQAQQNTAVAETAVR